MKSIKLKPLFCLLLLLFLTPYLYANSSISEITSEHFSSVSEEAEKLAKDYGPSHVLIVFDIDNTLLAMNQSLGSDQWFNWQANLLKKDAKSPELAANNFNGLLKAEGLLFELSHMHLTEKNIPQVINKLKQSNYPMVVITSRGYNTKQSTLKALNENNLDFHNDFNVNLPCYSYYPYQLNNLKGSGLTEKDIATFKLGKPRKVEFESGVLFGAGQNKGVLLKTLLSHSKDNIKAVIFVDDSKKNMTQFDQVMADSPLQVVSIRYSHEDDIVSAFEDSDKKNVVVQWQRLNQVLNEVFKSS